MTLHRMFESISIFLIYNKHVEKRLNPLENANLSNIAKVGEYIFNDKSEGVRATVIAKVCMGGNKTISTTRMITRTGAITSINREHGTR